MNRAWLVGLCCCGIACCQPRPEVPPTPAPLPSCPDGYARDVVRAQVIRQMLREAHEPDGADLAARACFGDAAVLGVLSEGAALLDRHERDPALAARLVHLAVHRADGLGDGCARGLEHALASETQANAREARLRVRWGLAPLPAPHAAEADYRRRCARP